MSFRRLKKVEIKRFMKYRRLIVLSLFFSLLAVACEYDDVVETKTDTGGLDAWLLNEGLWNSNNAELSHFNTSDGTVENDVFAHANERRLGDTGQDILLYGNRIYVSVFASGTIEVIDPATGRSYRQISMGSRQPRYLAAHGGKVYVSCYNPHSVVRIDTVTLEIEATCLLSGLRPEGMCVFGDSLYVCNSFDQRSNGSVVYDSTLSVVNLTTFEEVDKLPIGLNPNHVDSISPTRLAVCCWGDYGNTFSEIVVLDRITHKRLTSGVAGTAIAVYGGKFYSFYQNYSGTTHATFFAVDANTLVPTPILEQQASRFVSPYGIAVNPANGDILVTDSQNYRANGDIYCFSADGTLRWRGETTMGPSKIVFQ